MSRAVALLGNSQRIPVLKGHIPYHQQRGTEIDGILHHFFIDLQLAGSGEVLSIDIVGSLRNFIDAGESDGLHAQLQIRLHKGFLSLINVLLSIKDIILEGFQIHLVIFRTSAGLMIGQNRSIVDTLAEYDEPVVLVMYGDHLPTMGLEAEDLKNRYLFQTQYVMWDNMGLKKKDVNLAAYQMAAEVLDCPLDWISVCAADTDSSPYDSGSYASSTTYVTGKAVERAARKLQGLIRQATCGMLEIPEGEQDRLEFDRDRLRDPATGRELTLRQIGEAATCGNHLALIASETNSSPISPPPFMVGMAEIELDKETGQVELVDYVAVVDCGTPVNPNLARVQTEGGLVQGIGMALCEDVRYSDRGQMLNNSFMQYKIPTRLDMGKLRVEFESSYEPTGPFGAKSIGEIVINTPSPAIVHAIANATGLWFTELPVTGEKIWKGLQAKKGKQDDR